MCEMMGLLEVLLVRIQHRLVNRETSHTQAYNAILPAVCPLRRLSLDRSRRALDILFMLNVVHVLSPQQLCQAGGLS